MCPLIIIPGVPQERLVGKGYLVDRWMLRTAGEACNEEAAHDKKYDYGYITEIWSAWRRPIGHETSTTSKEMSVDMIVRRPQLPGGHTLLYTFVSCSFNVGKSHGFTNFRLTLWPETQTVNNTLNQEAVFADGSTWDVSTTAQQWLLT